MGYIVEKDSVNLLWLFNLEWNLIEYFEIIGKINNILKVVG